MPIVVSTEDIRPGMRLSEAFLFKGRIMLPGGKELSSEDVDILRRKYPSASLKIGDPVLDSLVNFEDDSREREVANTVTHKIAGAMGDVQQKFGQRANVGGNTFTGIQRTVGDVVEYLKANPVSAALINRNSTDKSYLAEHAGNVFYLSMVLGSAVRDYVVRERQRQTHASNLTATVAMDLLPLGLGAMLLDIGMAPLERVFAPDYKLTDDDRKLILEHPAAGADMLPDSMPPVTKVIVRQHHENFDGSGYPARAPGNSLHVFVRIVRICDAFDAATSDKLYKGAKSATRVLWEMSAGPFKKFYDPVLTKVFCGTIQPFPIGGKLTLADGRTAVVVKYNRQSPFNPTVIIAFDEQGNRLPPDKLQGPLNVGEGNKLRLKSFAGEDISYVQEVPPPITAASTPPKEVSPAPRAFQDLVQAAYP
ncbi:MAG TPA: HD domain-containing phosphohydrolase [Phycisphaerae bacterium]|nr:HD domain-containing phosphohydrolase [Phycisphaerae bacterium]